MFFSQGHLLLANRKDPSDLNAPASQFFLNESKVGFDSGPFRLGIHFSNRLLLNSSLSNGLDQRPFTLEKKSLAGEWGNWDFQLGDSYQEFGKGIALSLYQDDIFGVNHTLEGASIRYRPKGFEFTGFAGRLNAINTPVAVYALDNSMKDRTVWMAGASIGGAPWASTKMSAHYLLAVNQPRGHSGFDKTWTTVGVTFQQDQPFAGGEAYAEVNTLIARINLAGRDSELPRGWGAYSTVSWTPSRLKLRWEGKFYEEYQFEFRRPPTLEEDVIESSNTQNVVASKWLADYQFGGQGSIGASYLLGYDKPTGAPIHHWVGNGKRKIIQGLDIETKVGYRTSPQRNWLVHGSVKAKIKTLRGQYLELGYRKQLGKSKLDLLPLSEDRNTFDLSYAFSERVTGSIGYENLPENDAEIGQHFAHIGATMRWGTVSAKGMVGQTSGGTVCSGGVCRQVPPFSGALLETTYSF